MRIDHIAYQRAARVAVVGLLVQIGLGLVLLLFGRFAGDSLFVMGSLYAWIGVLVWLGLVVVFNQHKQERLEALELDELASGRPDRESFFQTSDGEIHVAARRLGLMYRWVMPILSLVTAGLLVLVAWLVLRYLGAVRDTTAEFNSTTHRGWGIALSLAFAVMAFILSRFVAGMAKQEAWQNLRGGAAFMVGNALICLLIGVGVGLRFFGLEKEETILLSIAMAIPIFELVIAVEIVLNFLLNLYRPRIAGETPRIAFDSKLLSLLAAPDNLVRSINEAVNYQFGFDVTSSWGYQLLLRSFARLVILGVVVMVVLNMVVIVEPYEQAIKLSRGKLVGEPHGSGVMLKLPWPFQSAEVYDVTRVRQLHLTARHLGDSGAQNVQLWTDDLDKEFDRLPDPFLVASYSSDSAPSGGDASIDGPALADVGEVGRRLATDFSLVDAEIILEYRIRPEQLIDFLSFGSDELGRGANLAPREMALRNVAQREVGQAFARLSLEDVLGAERIGLSARLVRAIQDAFDRHSTGVEVVGINLPIVRPAGQTAESFVEFSISSENRRHLVEAARQDEVTTFAGLVGSEDAAASVLELVERVTRLRDEKGNDHPDTMAARAEAREALVGAGGLGAQIISEAERDRWVRVMQARAEASRMGGQRVSYVAAPRLYRERELMKIYAGSLRTMRKYVLGIDPARVDFSFDVKELNPLFSIGEAVGSGSGG